jgi:hypothetical protein
MIDISFTSRGSLCGARLVKYKTSLLRAAWRFPRRIASRFRRTTTAPSRLRGRRDFQLLPNLDLIGIFQLIRVGIEDSHVVRRVSVELLADLRKSISGLNGVGLNSANRVSV